MNKANDTPMQPTIVGLSPTRQARTSWGGISRARLIGAALVFLGLLSLSLLIAVIVQATHGKKNNNNNNDNNNNVQQYCLNRGCISAATQQLRFMDSTASADRCTNFYKYACGGWQQTHLIQSFDIERTILGDILNRRDGDIERLLDSPTSRVTDKSWERKVKTYYTECRDDYARVPDSGKAMVGLIQDRDTIDGWFLFDNNAENSSQDYLLKNQTVYQQLSHIHGDLGVLAIFGLRIKFDDADPTAKRLEFFPAGLTMDVNDYLSNDSFAMGRRSNYQLYILEILALLAQDAGISDGNLSDRMFTVASDVFAIEKTLAEYVQLSKAAGDKQILTTLQEMFDEYSFDFPELMFHELGDPTVVSAATPVYLSSPVYFQEAFLTLLSRNEDDLVIARQIHNYLRWRLVRTYIEDLSYGYVHAHRIFSDNYYGYPLHSTNEAYCTREVIRRFPLAIQRLYTMNSTTHTDAVQKVQSTFNALKDGFKQYINEQATWMNDAATKTSAIQKIDALTAAIGYASIASDDARLDDYYEHFVVIDDSHFQNAYMYHRFNAWIRSTSLKNPDQLDHWDFFETRTSRLFDYIAIFNRLFVIASAMHEPLVSTEWPWSMNIGSLGVLLAQKLFSIVDTTVNSDTQYPDWWSSGTRSAYNTSRNCITNYYVNDVKTLTYKINGVEVVVQLAGEPFSPTTLRHIGALRFAYTALQKVDEMKSLQMPGTNLTSAQSFFLAYAQTQCYERQELLQLVRTQLGTYDEQTALNAALVHMPEFTQAFRCQPKANQCF